MRDVTQFYLRERWHRMRMRRGNKDSTRSWHACVHRLLSVESGRRLCTDRKDNRAYRHQSLQFFEFRVGVLDGRAATDMVTVTISL